MADWKLRELRSEMDERGQVNASETNDETSKHRLIKSANEAAQLARVDVLKSLASQNLTLLAYIEKLHRKLNERCPVDAMDRGMSPVEAAVWHVWGERCSDFEPSCLTCKAWAEFDRTLVDKT